MSGQLILVATPIGNLDDLSPRALKALHTADLLLCEDTRHSAKLTKAYGITTPREAFHEHNENKRLPAVLERLKQGARVALVCDAGTPLVSDPGYKLVREALAAGVNVTAIPGPAAPIVALVLSGLPPLPFAFFGFAPAKPGARQRFIEAIAAWPHTAICFLSPHRGGVELAALAKHLGQRPAALARELTKMHESVLRGSLSELATVVATTPPKGEWTLVLGPEPSNNNGNIASLVKQALAEAQNSGSLKTACQNIAHAAGVAWRPIYKLALQTMPQDAQNKAIQVT